MSELDAGGVTPPEDVPGEAPATDAPGAKVYICPACGTRYDEPTECAIGHAPTQTVEYDRATVEAAAAGDADALATVNETATNAAGGIAGIVPTEATPAPTPGTPVPAPAPGDPTATSAVVDPTATAPGDAAAIAAGDPTTAAPDPAVATAPGAVTPAPDVAPTTTPDGIGGPGSAVTPDGVHPNVAAIGAAIANLEAALAAARTAFGLGS